MLKHLIVVIVLFSSVCCRHTDSGPGDSTVKSLSTSEADALTFLKDRGIIINPNKLSIETFTGGSKPDSLNDLEVGDVLSEIKVLVRRQMLEPVDQPVASLSEVGAFLAIRAKEKGLATTLRFTRPSTKKLFGVTVASEL
jgi:hypothetical protein